MDRYPTENVLKTLERAGTSMHNRLAMRELPMWSCPERMWDHRLGCVACEQRYNANHILVFSLSNSYIFIMPFENVSGMIFGKFPPNLDVPAIPLLEVVKRF